MAIKAHEQVIINDFEAHLAVIKNNINIANRELEKSLSERDINKINYAESEYQIAEKNRIIESLDLDIESKRAYIATRENAAEVSEARLRKDKEEFEQYIQSKSSDIKSKEQEIEESILAKKSEVKKLEDIISGLKEQIEVLVNYNDEYSVKKYDLSAEITLLESKLAQMNEELFETEKEIGGKLVDLNNTLNGLQIKIEEEKAKIELPRKNLEKEKADLEIKQKDILILTNRLRKLYKEQGVEISI